MTNTARCPYCGRVVSTRLNRWRDVVYANHDAGRMIYRAQR